MSISIKEFTTAFQPQIDKLISDFRQTETGRQLRNEYIKQELEALANNPLVWVAVILAFVLAARR